jgi:hypothetical protein
VWAPRPIRACTTAVSIGGLGLCQALLFGLVLQTFVHPGMEI